eukprot:SAG22_NODE_124_length_18884_cov_34.149367_2_plen_565_part_00
MRRGLSLSAAAARCACTRTPGSRSGHVRGLAAVAADDDDDALKATKTEHFAGRGGLGRPSVTTLSVHGVHHRRHTKIGHNAPGAMSKPNSHGWSFATPLGLADDSPSGGGGGGGIREEATMVVGAACSTIFSGANLARALQPGFDLEARAMAALAAGQPAPPLSIHTSAGTPPALGGFLHELGKHLPWPGLGGDDPANRLPRRELGEGRHLGDGGDDDDWFVSLQVEGASAVWAACDLLLQQQATNGRPAASSVAVGAYSYHGPQATSLGSGAPMPSLKPAAQLQYPVPATFARRSGEDEASFHRRLLGEFDEFLAAHGPEIGVLLVEPQWGSSVAAQPWPKELLKQYIERAQAVGVLVCADEIMCGLGRHGQGPAMFVSDHKVWDLRPDAVTFGKAIGAGVYPLSGCIVRRGARALGAEGKSVLQMHTYAGASTRALMAGQAVLEMLPEQYEHVAAMGELCAEVFADVEAASDGTMQCHGHGLMWGGLFSPDLDVESRRAAAAMLKTHCAGDGGVWPYFVPAGGFMVTPPLDTPESDIREMGRRLETAVAATADQLRTAHTVC